LLETKIISSEWHVNNSTQNAEKNACNDVKNQAQRGLDLDGTECRATPKHQLARV